MKVGFIGLGNMGGPMALNIIKGGHSVTVFDLRKETAAEHVNAGATLAASPQAVAAQSDLVMTSLPGPREVEHVVFGEGGISHGIRSGSIYVDVSSSSPDLIRQIHAAFKPKGVEVLDAPVAGGGGHHGAVQGTLTVMVGGDEAVFHKVEPVLKLIGDKVYYFGALGNGMIAKTAHNQLCMVTSAAIAECVTMGVKAGVKPQDLYLALKDGDFGQGVLLGMLPYVVFPGAYDAEPVSFPLKMAHKDLAIATELGRRHNVPMPLAALVEQQLTEGLARGLGDKGGGISFKMQEDRAGVKVRAR
jgi:3-hydroxyisobutyrate dehydrogenase